MIEAAIQLIGPLALYLVIGLPACMVIAGDSLGAFPIWLWPIWPIVPILFVAGEIHYAYIQRKDDSPP